MRSLVWFRNDLRVHDHPALHAAAADGETIACFCLSHRQWRSHDMGDWRLAFVLRTLERLKSELADRNIPLRLLPAETFADVPDALASLCETLDVSALHFIDEYPLDERNRDDAVRQKLEAAGVRVERHVADVLVEPGVLNTGAGRPYTVFTPFFRKWQDPARDTAASYCPAPARQAPVDISSDEVPTELDGVDAASGAEMWPAGEAAAVERLDAFIAERVGDYGDARDIPAVPGTSGLSAYLAVGAISPRQCLRAALQHGAQDARQQEGVDKWISELAWRDFYRHIVARFDHVNTGHAFRREMDALPWRQADEELAAWQEGQTGYPLVDAAMRQLNATGWMHNRLRMVAAMFLSKHLLIDWHAGERYFMSRLVDGDFASNNGGWQWSAATGTDAAPYFRIFNPATQGTRFDADGRFTRHWVPELADVAPKYLFEPHQVGPAGYPQPIVEHKAARERALAFFKANM